MYDLKLEVLILLLNLFTIYLNLFTIYPSDCSNLSDSLRLVHVVSKSWIQDMIMIFMLNHTFDTLLLIV